MIVSRFQFFSLLFVTLIHRHPDTTDTHTHVELNISYLSLQTSVKDSTRGYVHVNLGNSPASGNCITYRAEGQ